MEGCLPDQATFPILDFPREIRDMIWRNVVLSPDGNIRVSFTNTQYLSQQGGFPVVHRSIINLSAPDGIGLRRRKAGAPALCPCPPPRPRHVHLPIMYPGPDQQYGSYFSPQARHADWNEYAVARIGRLPSSFNEQPAPSHPDLALFYTCHQIYDEAREIYYQGNNFVFCTCNQSRLRGAWCGINSIHAALSFLRDRPAASRRHIHNIELHLFNFYAPGHKTPLIDAFVNMLMSRSMGRIHHLTLNVSGMIPYPVDPLGNSWCPRHVRALINLSGITRLTIRHVTAVSSSPCHLCPPHFLRESLAAPKLCQHHNNTLRAAAFIELIRSSVLVGGRLLGHSQIHGNIVCNHVTGHSMITFETDDVAGGKSIPPLPQADTTIRKDGSAALGSSGVAGAVAESEVHGPEVDGLEADGRDSQEPFSIHPYRIHETDIFKVLEGISDGDYLGLLTKTCLKFSLP